MFSRDRPNSPTLTLDLAFAVKNMAVCASNLKPSAVPSLAGVRVALGKLKGILGKPIEYIEHNGHANTADYTERDRLNHLSTSATMDIRVTVTGDRLSFVF